MTKYGKVYEFQFINKLIEIFEMIILRKRNITILMTQINVH